MKQINIIKTRFGNTIATKTYIIDNIDCFIKDVLNKYIDIKNQNNKLNNNNIIYKHEVVDIENMNRYDFYNDIKEKTLFEQSINDALKIHLEKLQKYADKHRKK